MAEPVLVSPTPTQLGAPRVPEEVSDLDGVQVWVLRHQTREFRVAPAPEGGELSGPIARVETAERLGKTKRGAVQAF